MKVLLIGPHPPPHGGISVHVSGIQKELLAAGVNCRILDTSRVRPGMEFVETLIRYSLQGWTLHFHTNGHNAKSWLLALGCGVAGQFNAASILTLHSGMLPGYLDSPRFGRRCLATLTCSLYKQVICVSTEIRSALLTLGLQSHKIDVLPAFLGADGPLLSPDSGLAEWIGCHQPVFSTVLFFRPEYGFDLLVAGLARIRGIHPSFGCVVIGSGEQRTAAEKLVRDTGLEDHILLLGDVDHNVCLSVMSSCDVFLRPTLEDGDSISVREALSMDVPVVASRAGTRPAGAILFRPGDVEEMLAKIELALKVERSGPARSSSSMDRLMEIYRRVNAPEGSLCLN